MGRCLVGLLLLTAGLLPPRPAPADEPAPRRLRVLCYNIHHGEGADGRVDLPRLAEVIRQSEPDLVALQEVDNGTTRTGRVDQIAVLAELTGLRGRFAKAIDYGGGEYGQAILSRHPLPEVTVTGLPGRLGQERRVVASVAVEVEGLSLTFASTHLDHQDAETREEQAEALVELFADAERPVILAGDLNATPESGPLAVLRRHWDVAADGDSELPTYPAAGPERQIDYVLFRPRDRFRVASVRVIEEPLASDHRPVLVEFEYRPDEPGRERTPDQRADQ